MLVLQHSYGNSIQVETVQEVLKLSRNGIDPKVQFGCLNVALTGDVHPATVLQLDQCLGHRFHNRVVSAQNGAQLSVEFVQNVVTGLHPLELEQFSETFWRERNKSKDGQFVQMTHFVCTKSRCDGHWVSATVWRATGRTPA